MGLLERDEQPVGSGPDAQDQPARLDTGTHELLRVHECIRVRIHSSEAEDLLDRTAGDEVTHRHRTDQAGVTGEHEDPGALGERRHVVGHRDGDLAIPRRERRRDEAQVALGRWPLTEPALGLVGGVPATHEDRAALGHLGSTQIGFE